VPTGTITEASLLGGTQAYEDAPPEVAQAWEQARHAQSSARICVEHAIAGSKHWRPLQRRIGRREDLPETVRAIGSLVSDRAAAW
jgi:hypothetical protein